MITLTEAKQQLNIPASNTAHNNELQAYIDAAAAAVERYTGRIGEIRTIEGEQHAMPPSARLWLFHAPVQSVLSMSRIDGSQTWDTADLGIDSSSGLIRVISGPLLSGLLEVDYEAGHEDIPAAWNLAARIIMQHLWTTQRGVMGAADVRSAMEGSFQGGSGYAIPNAAVELLGEPAPVIA